MAALFRASKTADFDRLYQRHVASVYRYAYAVVGNHADAAPHGRASLGNVSGR